MNEITQIILYSFCAGHKRFHWLLCWYDWNKGVGLTTSKAEEDVLRTYDLGVSSFITKPVTFEGLVEIMKNLAKYWFDIATLPPGVEGRENE